MVMGYAASTGAPACTVEQFVNGESHHVIIPYDVGPLLK